MNSIPIIGILSIILQSPNVNSCPEIEDAFEPLAKVQVVKLCRSEYELAYSTERKITVWAAERLTSVEANDTEPRENQFVADDELSRGKRAELYDYTNSGYDRGHIVPAGDMHTLKGMLESFYLSNMMPQVPGNNRGIWKSLEKYAKDTAKLRKDVLIITGPIISKTTLTIGPNRIPVPRAMFKIIYDLNTHESWSFLIPNEKLQASALPNYLKKKKDIEKETGLTFPFQSNEQDKMLSND